MNPSIQELSDRITQLEQTVSDIVTQGIDILTECIKAQDKNVMELRDITQISGQITQGSEFLSRLRLLKRNLTSIQKQIKKEIERL